MSVHIIIIIILPHALHDGGKTKLCLVYNNEFEYSRMVFIVLLAVAWYHLIEWKTTTTDFDGFQDGK